MTKVQAITAANSLQSSQPESGPYFVMWDDVYRRFIVLDEHDFMIECDIDYAETQEQTVYDTWT